MNFLLHGMCPYMFYLLIWGEEQEQSFRVSMCICPSVCEGHQHITPKGTALSHTKKLQPIPQCGVC